MTITQYENIGKVALTSPHTGARRVEVILTPHLLQYSNRLGVSGVIRRQEVEAIACAGLVVKKLRIHTASGSYEVLGSRAQVGAIERWFQWQG